MNQYLNFSLEGKVALVTGASYGYPPLPTVSVVTT